jgi:GT2 family glycosyltransferase
MIEEQFGASNRVIYLHLDQPNASAARNAGLFASNADLVAFVDDDCVADRGWLAALVNQYRDDGEDVVAVTGRVLPLFTEGRQVASSSRSSTMRRVFRAADGGMRRGEWAPWDVGTGANILASRAVLASIGGFDTRLGPGSKAHAAEDIDLLYRLTRAGAVVYQPTAVVYHPAEQSRSRLRSRYRYGTGMGFMLGRHIKQGDRTARRVLMLYLRLRLAKLFSRQLGRLPERVIVLIGALTALSRSLLEGNTVQPRRGQRVRDERYG